MPVKKAPGSGLKRGPARIGNRKSYGLVLARGNVEEGGEGGFVYRDGKATSLCHEANSIIRFGTAIFEKNRPG